MNLDTFTRAYVDALLWSSTDADGVPLDENYNWDDFAPIARANVLNTCSHFQIEFAETWDGALRTQVTCTETEYAGHDLWLTRCGHGCGFWDGDWAEPAASLLGAGARALGDQDAYVGDDGLIYLSPGGE